MCGAVPGAERVEEAAGAEPRVCGVAAKAARPGPGAGAAAGHGESPGPPGGSGRLRTGQASSPARLESVGGASPERRKGRPHRGRRAVSGVGRGRVPERLLREDFNPACGRIITARE
ncbi:transcription initiation factor TFIID subunit 4-like [Pipra filicauda]|uniref:Transcription initiation factor TFIID subunit 4-like n=1 Tax=Pipra filicauda TaxID=649802 RepID=A0A7R5KZF0_9PASS|nr:transcription initiation factor TFIID subunit 4-like [Pipra filicauda]